MKLATLRRLKLPFWKRWRTKDDTDKRELFPQALDDGPSPVGDYYANRIKNNLRTFRHFAVQSRSLMVREVFARVASRGRLGLSGLSAALDTVSVQTHSESKSLEAHYDIDVLLALGNLIANTARSDLDVHLAVQIFSLVHGSDGPDTLSDEEKLLYVEALAEIGEFDEMDRLAKSFAVDKLAPLQQELLEVQRLRRNCSSNQESWLHAMNRLYESLELSPVELSANSEVPLLDRLKATSNQKLDGPKISVIVPTFSPGIGLRTAIRSLLQQTWENIEIIVVDDASPQEFQPLLTELEQLDTRIRVVRQAINAGAYVARNTGLELATGEFVTTHDDDDWSHPDKLAFQVGVLLHNKDAVATTSAHIRTTHDMKFQRINSRAQYLQLNYSSLLFRKSVTDEIGPWDSVNRGGDSEFLTRLIEYYGADRVLEINDKPLSFSRTWTGSLTSGEMHRGYFDYSRLLYRWAFRQWQWHTTRTGKKLIRKVDQPRPYPVPTSFQPGQRGKDMGLFDVIYVTDFFRQARFVDFVLNEINTLQDRGLRVGFMHLYSPQTTRPAGFPPELFLLQQHEHITQVSLEDVAETELLVLYDTSIGMFSDELTSSVICRRAVGIDHELPKLSGAEEREPTLLKQAVSNLDATFNTYFEIVGATKKDQMRLKSRLPADRLLPDSLIWNLHINERPQKIKTPEPFPKVGFHSYGNKYRWPSNSAKFNNVYVSYNYQTKLYGVVQPAQEKFGDVLLDQVDIISMDETTESDFLSGVDFWIYYPHDRLQEQIWGPVLKAMQAGKVVVLPRRLEPLYGNAAVYANDDEVSDVVLHLSRNPEHYINQAQRGQAFVAERYWADNFLNRIEKLGYADKYK